MALLWQVDHPGGSISAQLAKIKYFRRSRNRILNYNKKISFTKFTFSRSGMMHCRHSKECFSVLIDIAKAWLHFEYLKSRNKTYPGHVPIVNIKVLMNMVKLKKVQILSWKSRLIMALFGSYYFVHSEWSNFFGSGSFHRHKITRYPWCVTPGRHTIVL